MARSGLLAVPIFGAVCAAACPLAGCSPPAPAKPMDPPLVIAPPPPQKPVIDPAQNAWRPDWWKDAPEKGPDGLGVCAYGTDKDLLAARKKAIEAATGAFVDAAGVPPIQPVIRADSLRLSDGTFRAFVQLTAKPK